MEGGSRDLGLGESAMEEYGPLGQSLAGPLLERDRGGEEGSMCRRKPGRGSAPDISPPVVIGGVGSQQISHMLVRDMQQLGNVLDPGEDLRGGLGRLGSVPQQTDVVNQALPVPMLLLLLRSPHI